jgi:hypothetical protein
MRFTPLVLVLSLSLAPALPVHAAPMLLNEYNAVNADGFLGGSSPDPYFGFVMGNGGDWFEMVVITDRLDIRGWQLDLAEGAPPVFDETLTFSQALVWSDLRSGTIITVSEDVLDDASYDPLAGDWWINANASDTGTGLLISASNFSTNNTNWQLTIRDSLGAVVFGPAGEGIFPVSGIGGDEVFKLETDPSDAITPTAPEYNDGSSSTFGAPNRWEANTLEQDFSALRSVVPEPASGLSLAVAACALIAARRLSRGRSTE